MRQFLCGVVLGLTLTSVSVIAAPGDEFRGDLEIWADQQRADQTLAEQERRIQQLELRSTAPHRSPC